MHSRLFPSSARPTILASGCRGSGAFDVAPVRSVTWSATAFSYLGGKRWSSASRSSRGILQPVTVPGIAILTQPALGGGGFRQSLDEIAREVDQRIVARAHDEDPVAGPCFGNQRIANARAVGDMVRILLVASDLTGQPVRSAHLLDRPAVID